MIMKTKNISNIFCSCFICCCMVAAFTSCSDDFLAEKRPYGSFGENDIYNDWESVKLRLNYIYQSSLPAFRDYNGKGDNQGNNSTATNGPSDQWPVGFPDFLSTNADEFAGYGNYGYGYLTDPSKVWDNTNIFKFFWTGVNESPWKKTRECTDVIVKVPQYDGLTENQKKWATGQAHFFRATRYFRLFKRFGGTPIIRDLQSTTLSDTLNLRIARQSTEDTYNFIIEDLTTAAAQLPARWEEEANDWGRITAGTALALAGYVANYYASPVFNRNDDTKRWQQAYELNKQALEKLAEGHFGLSYEEDPGKNASNWAKIWCNIFGGDNLNSEAVYMANCNNASGNAGDQLYNCTEQKLRPSNCGGSGGITPSAEMLDAFPMADGKRPAETGQYAYDPKLFFLNRDPRFYRTFAFPGTTWQFSGSITGDLIEKCPYATGVEYELQNYAWYPTAEEANDITRNGYFTDLMAGSGRSIYVRKKSQDYALGVSPMYVFDSEQGFARNGQPLIAMRYTEVLLNFAEAACGANHLDEAWNALIKIRRRVGYKDNCGLDPSIQADRARMFEAILYERRIELAYEGKRFDDCHRWMLFDGGTNQNEIQGAPSTWTLTGFNGNTCQYLGVTPLNEVSLHRIELYFDPAIYLGSRSPEADPFLNVDGLKKPKALTLNEDFTTTVNEEDGSAVYADANVKALAEFYGQYLQRKDIATQTIADIETGEFIKPAWDRKCYLMGLQSADEENNPNVAQTIGWNSAFGGMGVFDPLSNTPVTVKKNTGE